MCFWLQFEFDMKYMQQFDTEFCTLFGCNYLIVQFGPRAQQRFTNTAELILLCCGFVHHLSIKQGLFLSRATFYAFVCFCVHKSGTAEWAQKHKLIFSQGGRTSVWVCVIAAFCSPVFNASFMESLFRNFGERTHSCIPASLLTLGHPSRTLFSWSMAKTRLSSRVWGDGSCFLQHKAKTKPDWATENFKFSWSWLCWYTSKPFVSGLTPRWRQLPQQCMGPAFCLTWEVVCMRDFQLFCLH